MFRMNYESFSCGWSICTYITGESEQAGNQQRISISFHKLSHIRTEKYITYIHIYMYTYKTFDLTSRGPFCKEKETAPFLSRNS